MDIGSPRASKHTITYSRRTFIQASASSYLVTAPAQGITRGTDTPKVGWTSGESQFYDLSVFEKFERTSTIKPDYLLYAGSVNDPWNGTKLKPLMLRNIVPIITLSLREADAVRRVASGEFDSKLGQFARHSSSFKTLVRPFHEMNGKFQEAWSVPDPNTFVQAFRHLRALWRSSGNDADFIWSPNVILPNGSTVDFEPYYPGDGHCDYVGLDGYNSQYIRMSFEDLFSESLWKVAALSRRPIIVAEVGSTSRIPGQSEWIEQMFNYLSSMPLGRRIKGLNWWQRDEWAIRSDTGVEAFRQGVLKWRAAYANSPL